jgi:hypothetical protein
MAKKKDNNEDDAWNNAGSDAGNVSEEAAAAEVALSGAAKPSKTMKEARENLIRDKVKELKKDRDDDILPDFDLDSALMDTSNSKKIITVYGHKNDAKTTTAMGVVKKGDKVAVLSFDLKSDRPTELDFVKKSNVDYKVFNAILYLDKSTPDLYQTTAEKTYVFVLKLLEGIKNKYQPDWVIIDGSEFLNKILEQVMRKRNGVMPYQGVANQNIWKERTQYIDDVHKQALDAASKGIMYTTYVNKDSVVKDGVVIQQKDMPKWLGDVMSQTDVIIRVITEISGGKTEYKAIIESSKFPREYPPGEYVITGKRLYDVINK